MIKRALTLVNAKHTTASVFINDDESGLHHDYEKWLERLAPHAPIDQAGPEAGCTTAPRGRLSVPDRTADAHLKRHGPPSAAVVVAVTNGQLDFGTWERIFWVSWTADT